MMLTTNEASTVLGVKPKTVAIYINRGLIAAEKRGRDYLIEDEELARFKRERRKVGNPGTKRGSKKTLMEQAIEAFGIPPSAIGDLNTNLGHRQAPTESPKRYPTVPPAERDT